MITPAFIHVIYWIGIVAMEFIGFNTIREGSPIRGTLGILLSLVVIGVAARFGSCCSASMTTLPPFARATENSILSGRQAIA